MAKTPPGLRSKESHCHLRQLQSDHREGCSLDGSPQETSPWGMLKLRSSQEAGSWARSQLACPKSSRDSGSIWLNNCFVSESLKAIVTHQRSKKQSVLLDCYWKPLLVPLLQISTIKQAGRKKRITKTDTCKHSDRLPRKRFGQPFSLFKSTQISYQDIKCT